MDTRFDTPGSPQPPITECCGDHEHYPTGVEPIIALDSKTPPPYCIHAPITSHNSPPVPNMSMQPPTHPLAPYDIPYPESGQRAVTLSHSHSLRPSAAATSPHSDTTAPPSNSSFTTTTAISLNPHSSLPLLGETPDLSPPGPRHDAVPVAGSIVYHPQPQPYPAPFENGNHNHTPHSHHRTPGQPGQYDIHFPQSTHVPKELVLQDSRSHTFPMPIVHYSQSSHEMLNLFSNPNPTTNAPQLVAQLVPGQMSAWEPSIAHIYSPTPHHSSPHFQGLPPLHPTAGYFTQNTGLCNEMGHPSNQQISPTPQTSQSLYHAQSRIGNQENIHQTQTHECQFQMFHHQPPGNNQPNQAHQHLQPSIHTVPNSQQQPPVPEYKYPSLVPQHLPLSPHYFTGPPVPQAPLPHYNSSGMYFGGTPSGLPHQIPFPLNHQSNIQSSITHHTSATPPTSRPVDLLERFEKTEDARLLEQNANVEPEQKANGATDRGKLYGRLRDYQRDLFDNSYQSNSIVIAPTGSGKTMVALAVIEHILENGAEHRTRTQDDRRKASPLVIFVSDRISLLEQQKSLLANNYPRELHTVLVIGKEHAQLNAEKIIKHADVIFIIADILVNWLTIQTLDLKQVDLVVFDEIHHCRKNHKYSEFFNAHYNQLSGERPQILGLTASPGAHSNFKINEDMLVELVSVTQSVFITPSNSDLEKSMDQNSCRPSELFQTVHYEENEEAYLDVIFSLKSAIIKKIRECGVELPASLQATAIEPFNAFCLENHPIYIGQERHGISRLLQLAQKLCLSQWVMDETGVEEAIRWVRANMENIYDTRKIEKQYIDGNTENAIKKAESDELDEFASEIIARLDSCENLLCVGQKHRKTQALLNVLRECAEKCNDGFKCMVIFKTKRAVERFSKQLSEEMPTCDVYSFWGHSESAGLNSEIRGMTQSEQQRVLKGFRTSKDPTVLAATNIAEEGLDIPDCNLVVRFDGCATVTSLIQSRGRARKKMAQFVVLLRSQEKDKISDFYVAMRNMKCLIKQMSASLTVSAVSAGGQSENRRKWYEYHPEIALNEYYKRQRHEHGEKAVPQRLHFHQVPMGPHPLNGNTCPQCRSVLDVPVFDDQENRLRIVQVYADGKDEKVSTRRCSVKACKILDRFGLLRPPKAMSKVQMPFTRYVTNEHALTNAPTGQGTLRNYKIDMETCPYNTLITHMKQRGYCIQRVVYENGDEGIRGTIEYRSHNKDQSFTGAFGKSASEALQNASIGWLRTEDLHFETIPDASFLHNYQDNRVEY